MLSGMDARRTGCSSRGTRETKDSVAAPCDQSKRYSGIPNRTSSTSLFYPGSDHAVERLMLRRWAASFGSISTSSEEWAIDSRRSACLQRASTSRVRRGTGLYGCSRSLCQPMKLKLSCATSRDSSTVTARQRREAASGASLAPFTTLRAFAARFSGSIPRRSRGVPSTTLIARTCRGWAADAVRRCPLSCSQILLGARSRCPRSYGDTSKHTRWFRTAGAVTSTGVRLSRPSSRGS